MTALVALAARLTRLCRDISGTALVETAIVAPVLVMMGLGGFEVSRIIVRQHELQNGAGDAEQIVLAAASGNATSTTTMRSVLASTLGISQSNIDVDKVYRCGTDTSLVTSQCSSGSWQSTYVQVTFRDTYTPLWTKFGVGSAIDYRVVRLVQVSAEEIA